MVRRAVVVHGAAQATAAARAVADLAPTVPLTLVSGEKGAESGGPGWFQGVLSAARDAVPEVAITGSLRCGGAPGLALAALRCGLTEIELDRSHPAYDRVRRIRQLQFKQSSYLP